MKDDNMPETIKRITCGNVKERYSEEGIPKERLVGVCGIETDKGKYQYDVHLSFIIKSPEDVKFDAVGIEEKEEKLGFVERLKKEFEGG